MNDTEKVETAEARMNSARDMLMKYVESGKVIDPDHHRRLLARLKNAEVEFFKAVGKPGYTAHE